MTALEVEEPHKSRRGIVSIKSPRMDMGKPISDGHYWAIGIPSDTNWYIDGGPFVEIVRAADGKLWQYPLWDGRTWEHSCGYELIEPVIPGEDPKWLKRCWVCGDWACFGPIDELHVEAYDRTPEEYMKKPDCGRGLAYGGRCVGCEDDEDLLRKHKVELEARLKSIWFED